MFSFLWHEFLYRPLYNLLIWLTSVTPGYNLGVAIVVLTIVIRWILYIPSRNSLKSQTAMQELQPKIQAINERYKNDPQQKAQETMRLYKESGVNPFGSCLPLLVQFPILIALFYVFRNGLHPEDQSMLYQFLSGFDFEKINVVFLGFLDLVNITPASRYLMPLIVGGLQFYQMKMMNIQQEKNKRPVKPGEFDPQAPMRAMTYVLPVMVAFFAASYAAGLSLYWATSTAFSIIQQHIVFKSREKIQSVKQEKKVEEELSEDLKQMKQKSKKKKRK